MITNHGILGLFKVFHKKKETKDVFHSIDKINGSLPVKKTSPSTIQTKSISLEDQLSIISKVDDYLKEYEGLEEYRNPHWQKGFTIGNAIYKTSPNQNQTICRTNMEVYFQERISGERKMNYSVSLLKLPEDQWRIMQVKIQS